MPWASEVAVEQHSAQQTAVGHLDFLLGEQGVGAGEYACVTGLELCESDGGEKSISRCEERPFSACSMAVSLYCVALGLFEWLLLQSTWYLLVKPFNLRDALEKALDGIEQSDLHRKWPWPAP